MAIGRHWKLVHTPNRDYESVMAAVLSVELIGLAELRHLFPTSRMVHERFSGLTKSIVAVKS